MANFALKLRPGEKVIGKWPCTVAARGEAPAQARERALALVTNARLFLFAENRLYLTEVRKSVDDAGNVSESKIPHDVVQFEAIAEDVLHTAGMEVWRADGAVHVTIAVGSGVVDVFLRCLEDVETPNLMGALADLRSGVAR